MTSPAMRPAPATDSDTSATTSPRILVYAHTHWDREWYQPFERFRMMLVHAIDRIIETLERDTTFTTFVLDGQTIVLDDYLAIRPHQRGRIERLVRAGRLEIGPWYILPDEFLVSGESMVRNLLEGRRGARAFGAALDVGYLPDPFGHVAQLPAILAGFGIRSVMFSRGMGDEFASLGTPFMWHAPDARVAIMAIVQTATYTNGYCNAELMSKPRTATDPEYARSLEVGEELAVKLEADSGSGVLVFAAGCDHETISPLLPELVEALAPRVDASDVAIAGLHEIVSQTEQAVALRLRDGEALPTWSGELRGSLHAPILAAIFSARIPLKQDNARLQTRLERCVEPLAAIAGATGAWTLDHDMLRQAWRYALQNQPHDSIGGCSVDATHLDMPPRTRAAHQICDGLIEDLLVALGAGSEQFIFNPAAEDAVGIVEMPSGELVATRALPALSLVAATEIAATKPGARVVSDRCIETDAMRIEVSDAGNVRVTLTPDAGTATVWDDVLRYVDVADAGDEYDVALLAGDAPIHGELTGVTSRLTPAGVAVLSLEHSIMLPRSLDASRAGRSADCVPTQIHTELRVADGVDHIECVARFTNTVDDHRLRVRSMLCGDATATTSLGDGHFAMVARPAAPATPDVPWRQNPVREQYCESAAVLPASDGSRGIALLTRGLHEYEAVAVGADGATDPASPDANALELTLLRSVGWLSRDDIPGRPGHAGPELATPGAQCHGDHVAEFAIMPFVGAWEHAGVAQEARRFAAPPVALPTVNVEHRNHSGQQSRERDIAYDVAARGATGWAFPKRAFTLAGAVLSAIKPADDGSGDIVLRAFNPLGAPVEARLGSSLSFRRVMTCRLDEVVLDGDESSGAAGTAAVRGETVDVWSGRLEPGEIVTLRLTPRITAPAAG